MNDQKEQKHEQDGEPMVEVVYLNTNEDTKFHEPWSHTVQQVWDTAYVKLGEQRKVGDQFETQDGKSIMPYLALTLSQLRDQHISANRKFQIKCETGGA